MSGIGIIHNPFAKGNLRRPWLAPKLRELVSEVGVFRETRNINELPQVAEEFIRQGIEIMAVNGGDGTLHLALTAFIKVFGDRPLPKLMSLRGGTMNTMSNSLKIKGKTLSILQRAVAQYRAGRPFKERPQHLIQVNDKYGFMSGGGVVANFLDAYYSTPQPGPWSAAKLLARGVASALGGTELARNIFRGAPVSVLVEGGQVPGEEFTIFLACTIRELGLGFTPTPRAYDKPGHFHFIAATIRPLQLALLLPAIWLGRDLVHPEIPFSAAASQAVVEPKKAIRWMVDGEMYDTDRPLVYSSGPTITIVEPD